MSPLQAWILRNEIRRNGERGRVGENGRTQTRNFMLVSEADERIVLADRPPAGDIKWELWPNLCRGACSMVSLHRIASTDGRPATASRLHRRVWIATDLSVNALWRISRLSDFYRWRRDGWRKRADGFEHRLQMIWKLRPSARSERDAGVRFHPPEFPSRSLRRDFRSRLHRFNVSNPGLARSLLRQNFVPATLRPVMNQKWTGDVSLGARGRYRPKTSPANLRSHTWWRLYIISSTAAHTATKLRVAAGQLTLMMRNHVLNTRSAKAFTCNVTRRAQLEWFAMREYALQVMCVTLILMIYWERQC